MTINILMVDDDPVQNRQIKKLLELENIDGENILVTNKSSLDEVKKNITDYENFDIIILDVYDKKKKSNIGEKILIEIKKNFFIPIIFYTGFSHLIEDHKSEIIRIVNKSEGSDGIIREIKNISNSNLLSFKKKLKNYLNENIRKYLWDHIHDNWENIRSEIEETSLDYLLIKRLGNALSERYIGEILGPDAQCVKKHPLECYIYPPLKAEIDSGDIIKKGEEYFLVLTPSCDLVVRENGKIKAEHILLVELIKLKDTSEYKEYLENQTVKNEKNLKNIISNNKSERYFFLPKTWFLENMVIDFQKIRSVEYNKISEYQKIIELDSLHLSSILANFIRHYDRIGTADLDHEKLLQKIKETL